MEAKNVVRIALTVIMLVLWFQTDGVFSVLLGAAFVLATALIWLGPVGLGYSGAGADPKHKFEPGFEPEFVHEHIALDTKQNRLWIRDREGKEAYLKPEDIASFRTNSDFGKAAYRQRIEVEITDLEKPVRHVMFQRHDDRWRWNSERNTQEVNEWAARIKAWAGMRTIR
ncbi:hypothetical protein QFW77_14660 [Luteimonas sp. RD2P54]|uniref:DUF4755 domain-containing protein n=1 Tax=Luteimonas endophytica TaxID=3042023 RepID=A0ABT6JBL1_9GAMM|nr:hypothetical protein [Luteimonas endophytica]MDH5824220.1 hypothetical protein [Luteimonas endophytica]